MVRKDFQDDRISNPLGGELLSKLVRGFSLGSGRYKDPA